MARIETLDLPSLRQRLVERAGVLRQEVRQGRSKLADDVGDAHLVLDRKDQADLVIQAGVDDAEFSRDLDELTQIEAALQRLQTGRFGRCEDCAEPIAAARLNVQPWASRCLACQALREKTAPT